MNRHPKLRSQTSCPSSLFKSTEITLLQNSMWCTCSITLQIHYITFYLMHPLWKMHKRIFYKKGTNEKNESKRDPLDKKTKVQSIAKQQHSNSFHHIYTIQIAQSKCNKMFIFLFNKIVYVQSPLENCIFEHTKQLVKRKKSIYTQVLLLSWNLTKYVKKSY